MIAPLRENGKYKNIIKTLDMGPRDYSKTK